MEKSFWQERWKQGRIGFHASEVNPNLVAHWDRLGATSSDRVLVPLCGKSIDLLWLSDRVGEVVGVEFVATAIEEFLHSHISHATDASQTNNHYTTQQLSPNVTRYKAQRNTQSNPRQVGQIEMLRADIFDLTREIIGSIDHVWDRAALVALPQRDRPRYANTICALAPGARLLLNSFDYDSSIMDGPPFSVDEAEVRQLFARCSIELLARADVIDRVPFRERGHSYWNSSTYLIELPDQKHR